MMVSKSPSLRKKKKKNLNKIFVHSQTPARADLPAHNNCPFESGTQAQGESAIQSASVIGGWRMRDQVRVGQRLPKGVVKEVTCRVLYPAIQNKKPLSCPPTYHIASPCFSLSPSNPQVPHK